MCGISGYISPKPLHAEAMVRSLQHRGPDDQGQFHDHFSSSNVFLGHNRLSIIDLSANGHQPMISSDGQTVIVFNGEVYNFESLRSKYFRNEHFRSKTDTEVVLKLYERSGMSFLKELNGDFAMAIYDKRKGKVFLIRDRAGVKPLYYFHENRTLIFGSEIKSIIAAGITPELNTDELQNYFVFKYVPSNATLHRNIRRVPPAGFMEFDIPTGSFSMHSYWSLQKLQEYDKISYRDACDRLYQLVQDSVQLRLISDVPIGNFLSGGLDSTILASFLKDRTDITHYCARKQQSDLRKEGTTDDFSYARQVADLWKLKLLPADIGKEDAQSEMISKTVYYSDDLIADGSQIPSFLITRSAAASSRVILSGMGADELFMGYAGHLLSMISNQWLDRMPAFLANGVASLASGIDQGKGRFLAYRRYLHKIGKYYHYPSYKYGLFQLVGDFENSASVYRGNKQKCIDLISSYYRPDADVSDATFRFETENFLVKNLHYTDRMCMANSVECRVPFLDHRIMELAYNLPREYKLTNTGNSKRILKDTFKQHVPQQVIKRRKAGFGMPLRSIFSDRNKVDSLLDRELLNSIPGFSLKDIDRLINSHIDGAEDNSSIIYALISFCEWYKVNIH